METAKFTLHKIASNSQDIITCVPEAQRLSAVDQNQFVSVLGVKWEYVSSDTISVKSEIKPLQKITKRIASYYDPLGIISPVLQVGRSLIQQIWIRDRDLKMVDAAHSWDQELPSDIEADYRNWYSDLSNLTSYRIPRSVNLNFELKQAIYGFADASQTGYGAVIYLRTVFPSHKVEFTFILSKAKVAPVVSENFKNLPEKRKNKIISETIPRLELGGVGVCAEQADKVCRSFELKKDFPVHLFTDSEIVLAQISGYSIREVYVENRVRKIRKLAPREQWAHVASENNPADLLSRGGTVKDLTSELWLKRPEIMRSIDFEPYNKFYVPKPEPEMIETCLLGGFLLGDQQFPFLKKFTSFQKTVRVMGYVRRACFMFKEKLKLQKRYTIST